MPVFKARSWSKLDLRSQCQTGPHNHPRRAQGAGFDFGMWLPQSQAQSLSPRMLRPHVSSSSFFLPCDSHTISSPLNFLPSPLDFPSSLHDFPSFPLLSYCIPICLTIKHCINANSSVTPQCQQWQNTSLQCLQNSIPCIKV
jgi:hypothetical protein